MSRDASESEPTSDADPASRRRLFEWLVGADDAELSRDIPDGQAESQPRNFFRQIASRTLSKTGDALANPKVVLPWVLGSVGAPTFLVGVLVPIRESLALLPQLVISAVIRRFRVRRGFWALGSLVQGLAVLGMGLVAALGVRGAAAGWSIVGLLVLFSLARGVASVASKDTLGKTISKGLRGRVGGFASSTSGVITTATGFYLALGPESARPDGLLYGLLFAAAAAWFLAAAVFSRIEEVPSEPERDSDFGRRFWQQFALLKQDSELRRFLLARTLMVATALTGPLYVTLAQRETGNSIDRLGWLVVATGLAGAVSSLFWGLFADRSSRAVMATGAGIVAVLGGGVLLAMQVLPALAGHTAFYAAALFVLAIGHEGVRIGRKTQIVDLAGKDRKAEYVALANTLIGVLLLGLGAVTSVLMAWGTELALGVLSATAALGAVVALTMKNVQSKSES